MVDCYISLGSKKTPEPSMKVNPTLYNMWTAPFECKDRDIGVSGELSNPAVQYSGLSSCFQVVISVDFRTGHPSWIYCGDRCPQ